MVLEFKATDNRYHQSEGAKWGLETFEVFQPIIAIMSDSPHLTTTRAMFYLSQSLITVYIYMDLRHTGIVDLSIKVR